MSLLQLILLIMNVNMNPNIQNVLFINIIQPNNLNKIMNLKNLSANMLALPHKLTPLHNLIRNNNAPNDLHDIGSILQNHKYNILNEIPIPLIFEKGI